MGLDMYLNKVKKVGNMSLKEIIATADYVSYLERPDKYIDSTFEDWCGGNETFVVKSKVKQIMENMEPDTCPAWADGIPNYEPYGESIHKNIAYWRKANQIHNWFVENVQDGNDDCKDYEVSKNVLLQLLNVVNTVLANSKLVDGKVSAGQRFTKNGWEEILEDGQVIEDTSVAEELLPTCSGCFFGGTDYDVWYYRNLETTKKHIEKILKETDFDNWIVYYNSSW